jgi:hypothetical protein
MKILLPPCCNQTTSFHAYHTKAETIVPIRRNNKANELAKEGKRDGEYSHIMSHPTDGEAWLTLDSFDLEFARDPSSVCLGLSTDGFQPHNPQGVCARSGRGVCH